jgi:DNA-binding CsgD family transcriptional regulator/tetratricopeptide (TPR) repeat protein
LSGGEQLPSLIRWDHVAISKPQDAVVGRDAELAAVRDLPAGALVLSGGPGIGKTTLWEAGVEFARERGARVLAVRSSGAETGLAFAALIDLCDGVDGQELAGLPPPQRAALEVALLRADPAGVAAEPHAIALGLRGLLRALAAASPVLVAVDDLQWLDEPSAKALVFATRRLEGDPVSFLLARRTGTVTDLERALERRGVEHLRIGPLSLGATRRLLAERLSLSLPRPLLRRVVESTLGNPLFALEVGRMLVERGLPPAGEDIPVPAAVNELLGSRVARLGAPARRLLLAVALSGDLHLDELATIEDGEAVEAAVDAGLLRVDGERVRPSHPLLAAAAQQRSRRTERRELHRALAGVVADRRLRALHLARATDRPDPDLAEALSEAALDTFDRGARQQAAGLAEHALRLTPADSPERDERLLDYAGYLVRAGELQRMTDLLAPEVPKLAPGPTRARGWLMLSEGVGPRKVADLEHLWDQALAECPDEPGLRAYALAKRTSNAAAATVTRVPEAEAWGLEALSLADAAGRDVERLALYALGWVRAMTGRPLDDLCARSDVFDDAGSWILACPERVAGQRHVWRGELGQARSILTRLLELADERGEPGSYAFGRLHVTELELRAGEWAAAERRLDEWAESLEGDILIKPMYQRCRALLAAGRGDAEAAERWAADAIARAAGVDSAWDRLEALRARGVAALVAREPERAAESLRAVWEHTQREGVEEPGVFPAAPELVEALVDLGEVDEAREVAERLHELAERHDHPWGRLAARRCRALVELAGGPYAAEHGDALAEAAAGYAQLGLRFDGARTLLSLGLAQRRLKQWGGARGSLATAAAAFAALGSPGWAGRASGELARVGGRRPRGEGELTPTERDVVELAARGMANKEIARTLHLGVHTVEVHLSRAYARLGVRNRAELAAKFNP